MHPLCLAVWYGMILCLSGVGCATSSIECSFNHGITTWRVAWYASADLVLVLTCAAGQQWGWVRSPLHHPSPQFFMWTCSVGCWSLTWAKKNVYISDISVEIWPIPKSYFAANRERRPDMAFWCLIQQHSGCMRIQVDHENSVGPLGVKLDAHPSLFQWVMVF